MVWWVMSMVQGGMLPGMSDMGGVLLESKRKRKKSEKEKEKKPMDV